MNYIFLLVANFSQSQHTICDLGKRRFDTLKGEGHRADTAVDICGSDPVESQMNSASL